MSNLQLLAKGGLVVLIIIAIAILIEYFTSSRIAYVVDTDDDIVNVKLINTTYAPSVDPIETIFEKKISKCLAEHSKSFYYSTNETSSACLHPGKCMDYFLFGLSILVDSLNIKLQLLEPGLLFCLLPSSKKYNLLTRGFSSNKVLGSRNVVTFGIHEAEAKILDEQITRLKLASSEYRVWRFQRSVNPEDDFLHYFIKRDDMVAHLIVLYPRGTYLWSPGFNTSEINLKGLQYVNDSAFENFTTSPTNLDISSIAKVYLPSDSRCFLLDMMSSNFLECKASSSVAQNMNHSLPMALKELKAILASQMVSFWLWSKSLQGWFENCDILHYSERLKFSVAAKSVDGFNFTALFANSECQHMETKFNLNSSIRSVKLNCHEMSIELIFMYEEKNSLWYEYLDGHDTYRLKFPKFSLCSTDIYGEKIVVPCETEEIFEGEYGQFLRNTTLNLDPVEMRNVQLIAQS